MTLSLFLFQFFLVSEPSLLGLLLLGPLHQQLVEVVQQAKDTGEHERKVERLHWTAHRVDIKESDVNGVTPRRLLLIILVQLIVDVLDLGQHHLLGVGKLNLWKLAFIGSLHVIGGEVDSYQLSIGWLVSVESYRIIFVLL